MLWFGKKKKKEAEDEKIEVKENDAEVDEELDLDEGVEVVSEDEILEELNFSDSESEESDEAADPDDNAEDNGSDKDDTDDEDDTEADETEESEDKSDKADVVKAIGSLDELVDYVNGKSIGSIQFMRKENNEAFSLREAHLRIARVWGSVSMAREYTAAEYARIMLAIEVINAPDDFYVLPVISDEEREKAIINFCEEKYGGNGKKYAKNTDKFAKLVNENGDKDMWLAHTKWIITEKITEFCEKHGITFEGADESDADTNAEGEADE